MIINIGVRVADVSSPTDCDLLQVRVRHSYQLSVRVAQGFKASRHQDIKTTLSMRLFDDITVLWRFKCIIPNRYQFEYPVHASISCIYRSVSLGRSFVLVYLRGLLVLLRNFAISSWRGFCDFSWIWHARWHQFMKVIFRVSWLVGPPPIPCPHCHWVTASALRYIYIRVYMHV